MVTNHPDIDIFSPTQQIFPDFAWSFLKQQFPDFTAAGLPEALSGGYLNYVWRITGLDPSNPASLIVKWAPAYIASAPDVWLDPGRIFIEARAMSILEKGGSLHSISPENIRPPLLYGLDETNHLMLMEDVGRSPDLGRWLKEIHLQEEAQVIGTSLGEFIGALHRVSARNSELASIFNNHGIQQTRLDFHYSNIQPYAQRAGLTDAVELGQRAIWLGERLLQPGKCLIMGDLWPASILVTEPGLRIIDWEMANYGRPSQDVGHLCAHLWMFAHRTQNSTTARNANAVMDAFLIAYRRTLGSQFDLLFGMDGVVESSVHFGSEIFARTVGAFQKDYVYSGLSPDHPDIQFAVQTAAAHITSPLQMKTFDLLGWRNNQVVNS